MKQELEMRTKTDTEVNRALSAALPALHDPRSGLPETASGPLRPTPESESINLALKAHQSNVTEWSFQQAVVDLHQWWDRFDLEFKLQVSAPCLLIEQLGRGTLGHFRRGRNGFGMREEIAINEGHVRHNPWWQVLVTLLHEELHGWQERHGKPGAGKYHNKEYRDKAASFGLGIDRYGHTQCLPGNTPFLTLLRKYGVKPPEVPEQQSPAPIGSGSKLKLYICPCGVRVRIGRSTFNAQCLIAMGFSGPRLKSRHESHPTKQTPLPGSQRPPAPPPFSSSIPPSIYLPPFEASAGEAIPLMGIGPRGAWNLFLYPVSIRGYSRR